MTAFINVRKGQTDMPYKGEYTKCKTPSLSYWGNLSYNHIRVHYNHAYVQGHKQGVI